MENTNEQPKKKGIGLKIVIWLTILIIVGYAGYIAYNSVVWNPVLVVTITTGINESNDNSPTITNVTFEQSRVIYKGSNSVTSFPEINIMVRNESLLALPVAYWAAVPWNQEEPKGKYTLTISFKETYIPKPGDMLILTIKQVGLKGHIYNKQTAFYEWR